MKDTSYDESNRKLAKVVFILLYTGIFIELFQHVYDVFDTSSELYNIHTVLLKWAILIPSIILMYSGFVLAAKTTIIKIEYIIKKHIIKNVASVCTAACCSIIVISCTYHADPNINEAEFGILFEIMGFIIFLTPVTKYMSKWIKNTEDKINHDIIVKTSAVIFVISGLFFQLPYFIKQ